MAPLGGQKGHGAWLLGQQGHPVAHGLTAVLLINCLKDLSAPIKTDANKAEQLRLTLQSTNHLRVHKIK